MLCPLSSPQTGQMLAALMGWPQATFASKLELDAAARKATVTREVDGGLETVSVGVVGGRAKLRGLSCTRCARCGADVHDMRLASAPGLMRRAKKHACRWHSRCCTPRQLPALLGCQGRSCRRPLRVPRVFDA